MVEWAPNSHITLAKNENYWDADKITLKTLTFVLMEDDNAAYNAYQTGEISMTKMPPTEEVPSLRDTADFHIEPIMGTYYINFQNQKEPFNNPDVRKALSLVIDRDYVANTVMQGTYAPAVNFVGPGISDAEEGSSANSAGVIWFAVLASIIWEIISYLGFNFSYSFYLAASCIKIHISLICSNNMKVIENFSK